MVLPALSAERGGAALCSRLLLLTTGVLSTLLSARCSYGCSSTLLVVLDLIVFVTTVAYHTGGGALMQAVDLTAVGTSMVAHVVLTATAETLPRYGLALAAYAMSKATDSGNRFLGGIDAFHSVVHLVGLWANCGAC